MANANRGPNTSHKLPSAHKTRCPSEVQHTLAQRFGRCGRAARDDALYGPDAEWLNVVQCRSAAVVAQVVTEPLTSALT